MITGVTQPLLGHLIVEKLHFLGWALGISVLNYFVNSFLNLTLAVFNRDTDCLSFEYLVQPCPPTQQIFLLSLFPTWLLADNEQPCHHQI